MADVDPLNDPAGVVQRYLLAERDLGRIGASADCRAAASIIITICHDDAFERYLQGPSARRRSWNREIELVAAYLTA
jgi:hypothetical protein